MATEEVSKPPSLPPYPQMIVEAIEALKQNEGSNKSSISNYIESKYGPLPAGHVNLLSDHLNRMKDSGEIIFFKNNYLKPDPNAPPRRGRGRPPKPKSSPPPSDEANPASPRGRGRPRKDPNAPPVPKKLKGPDGSDGPSSGGALEGSVTGRPRGRPRKVKPQATAMNGVEAS